MTKTTWTDSQGRTWSARVTIAEALRLKKEDDIDLLDSRAITELVSDPLQIVYLLCCIHSPQCEEHGVAGAGDFAEVCTETEAVAIGAVDALSEGLADFFGRLGKPSLANVVRRAMQAARQAEQAANRVIEEQGESVVRMVAGKAESDIRKAIANALK